MGRAGARLQARPPFRYRVRVRVGGRVVRPPGPVERAQLGISPLGRASAQPARVNERRQLFEDLGGEIQTGLERWNRQVGFQSTSERLGLDTSARPTLGPGASLASTREQFAALRRFLFAASLDPNHGSRLGNALFVANLLQSNEALLRDMGRHPERYRLESARRLQAIIVSEPFAERILGRRPRAETSISATPRSGPTSAAEWARIHQQQSNAQSATGVRMPTPAMLIHPDIEIILRHFGFAERSYPQAGRP